MKRPDFLFVTFFFIYRDLGANGSNGGVQNKILNNYSVLTGKYMLYRYKKESCIPKITALIGILKLAVQPDTSIQVTGILDRVGSHF